MKSEKFRICLSSPPDRERLVAEILIDNIQWAEVNQETGQLTLELYPRPDGHPWVLDFEESIQILQEAKEKLVGR